MADREPVEVHVPELPDWLRLVDEEYQKDGGLALNNCPADVIEAYSLLRRVWNGCDASAYELARLMEEGRTPDGPNMGVAMKWYEYAAQKGSAKAAYRLAHLQAYKEPRNALAGLEMTLRALQLVQDEAALFNWRSTEGWNLAAKIVLHALEHGYVESGNQTIDALMKMDGFQSHPDFDRIADRVRKLSQKGQVDKLSIQVVTGKIPEDSDFKVGIYRKLEKPLPLVPVPRDLDAVQRKLDQEFPWFSQINALVCRQLKVAQLGVKPAFRIRPLLLAGTHGVGKTTWARRFAEICGVPFRTVMAAGGNDNMYLRGTARGWSSARPGGVIQTIVTEEVANPLFMVDELEKASSDNRNGRLWDVLLQMLEPASSKHYLDECLQVPCDLSWVTWIASVNELGALPKPLLERFTVVMADSPGPGHFMTLVQGSIDRFAKELGIDARMLPELGVEELDVLRMCRGPREINRTVMVMLEKRLVDERSRRMH